MPPYIKALNTGSISTGSYSELRWTPDRDITLTKIIVSERADSPGNLNNVQVYIAVAGVPYTRDFVPANVIGATPEYCYKPNLAIAKGSEVYIKIVNSRATTADIDLVMEYTG